MRTEALEAQLNNYREGGTQASARQRTAAQTVWRLRRELADAEAELAIATQKAIEAWAREDRAFHEWLAAVLEAHQQEHARRDPPPSPSEQPAS